MNFQTWFGIILLVGGVLNITFGIVEKIDPNKWVEKSKIVEAFEGLNLSAQSFSCGAGMLEDKDGNKYFYAVKEIDKRIESLNKALKL